MFIIAHLGSMPCNVFLQCRNLLHFDSKHRYRFTGQMFSILNHFTKMLVGISLQFWFEKLKMFHFCSYLNKFKINFVPLS